MRETPAISNASYQGTAYGLGNLAQGNAMIGTTSAVPFFGLAQQGGAGI